MKRLTILNLFIAITLILGACSTSNNVVNNRLISKRKYNKGFHINKKGNYKSQGEDVASKDVINADQKASRNDVKSKMESRVEDNVSDSRIEASQRVYDEVVSTDIVIDDVDGVNFESQDSKTQISSELDEETAEATTSKKELKKAVKNQKKQKRRQGRSSGGDMFILAVIFAILIPPLGVGIYTNIDWMKVLICLLLCLLFVLPGMIYALLVVFDVI